MDKVIIDGVDVSGCEFCCENPLHEIKHSCNIRGYEKDNGLHIHLKCKDNPNCYYKQLKRKEQECEEWEKLANEANEQANDYANDIGKLQEDVRYYKELSKDFDTRLKLAHQDFTDFIQKQKLEISELKAENERLKKQYNCYACDSCSGKEDYINMKRHTENAIKTVHKYRQALQEIREYCEEQNLKADYTACEIIDKINSVIGVE